MLLEITTTYQPATDLGFLLHKHPAKCQSFNVSYGKVHIFYPEATAERCTAALLLDVNATSLVRRGNRNQWTLKQYVNDRAYVASSFMSSAIAHVYRSALNGQCRTHPELVATEIPLAAKLAVIASPLEGETLHRLFEPLGYRVQTEKHVLDPQFPDWGNSRYFTLHLSGTTTLSQLLTHLYVLIPVLDADKHYYINASEVEKLLGRGEGWLAEHPERNFITRRYLLRRQSLIRSALERLADDAPAEDEGDEGESAEEEGIQEEGIGEKNAEEAALDQTSEETRTENVEESDEKPPSLNEQRLNAVLTRLKESGATRVLDLGCGEGNLIRRLLEEKQFTQILGVDVSHWTLQKATRRLRLERMPSTQRKRVELVQGALTYWDKRLQGYDGAALVEVIEHLDPPQHRCGHDSQHRIQYTLPLPGSGQLAPSRSPLRVDARRVPRLGRTGGRAIWLYRNFCADRSRG